MCVWHGTQSRRRGDVVVAGKVMGRNGEGVEGVCLPQTETGGGRNNQAEVYGRKLQTSATFVKTM